MRHFGDTWIARDFPKLLDNFGPFWTIWGDYPQLSCLSPLFRHKIPIISEFSILCALVSYFLRKSFRETSQAYRGSAKEPESVLLLLLLARLLRLLCVSFFCSFSVLFLLSAGSVLFCLFLSPVCPMLFLLLLLSAMSLFPVFPVCLLDYISRAILPLAFQRHLVLEYHLQLFVFLGCLPFLPFSSLLLFMRPCVLF